MHDRNLNVDLCLMFIYGPAHDNEKELMELAQVINDTQLPLLIGGDFNIVRYSS